MGRSRLTEVSGYRTGLRVKLHRERYPSPLTFHLEVLRLFQVPATLLNLSGSVSCVSSSSQGPRHPEACNHGGRPCTPPSEADAAAGRSVMVVEIFLVISITAAVSGSLCEPLEKLAPCSGLPESKAGPRSAGVCKI